MSQVTEGSALASPAWLTSVAIAGPEGCGGLKMLKPASLRRATSSHHLQVPAGLCIYMQDSLGCSYVLDSALSHLHTWLKVIVERVLGGNQWALLTLGSAGVLLRACAPLCKP